MKKTINYSVISRFAIAQDASKIKNNIVVKVVYSLSFESSVKENGKYKVEVYSINGLIKYKIIKITGNINKVYFLKYNRTYFIDFEKSTFDFSV